MKEFVLIFRNETANEMKLTPADIETLTSNCGVVKACVKRCSIIKACLHRPKRATVLDEIHKNWLIKQN